MKNIIKNAASNGGTLHIIYRCRRWLDSNLCETITAAADISHIKLYGGMITGYNNADFERVIIPLKNVLEVTA